MKGQLRGQGGGFLLFVLISTLVASGLGWMTAVVLRLEREQQHSRAEAELVSNLRVALWRLDSLVGPDLSREEGRAYNHYSFLSRHPRTLVQDRNNRLVAQATVLQISPLLTSDLPEWILLHFQADESGWSSPQVPPEKLVERLQKHSPIKEFPNRTPGRAKLLAELKGRLDPHILMAAIDQSGKPPITPDRIVLLAQNNIAPSPQQQQGEQQSALQMNSQPGQGGGGQFGQFGQLGQSFDPGARSRIMGRGKNPPDTQNPTWVDNADDLLKDLREQGANWFNNDNRKNSLSGDVSIQQTPMIPALVKTGENREHLVLIREIKVAGNPGGRTFQGVLLDSERLQEMLRDEVRDLFPHARLEPIRDGAKADPLKAMATLPFQLDPGPLSLTLEPESWTPLRIGLALAWAAAGVALLAVAVVGWSLIDLSERRFRFVSAVTHELRTPLTTLRLYLDMLLNGLVRDEKQQREYLTTLHGESDRLSRLVNNVLDFSRLEKQRPNLVRRPVAVSELVEQVRATWQGRCQDAEKQLVVESTVPADAGLVTDAELVQQVLANLIDNACKYSREAEDPHIWLRASSEDGKVIFEVEDRGPGVPPRERRSIFRAFRRGSVNEATGGGVGLGLALAQRWTRLLGGRLILRSSGPGACFRLELPHSA